MCFENAVRRSRHFDCHFLNGEHLVCFQEGFEEARNDLHPLLALSDNREGGCCDCVLQKMSEVQGSPELRRWLYFPHACLASLRSCGRNWKWLDSYNATDRLIKQYSVIH